MNTKYCYKCGNELPEAATFCTKCGVEQVALDSSNNNGATIINNYYGSDNPPKVQKAPKNQKEVIGSSNPVNPIQAFKLFWKRLGDGDGVSSRSEYWYWWMFQSIILLLWIPTLKVELSSSFGMTNFYIYSWLGVTIILSVWTIACIVPTITLQIRRLRDAGMHGIAITLLMFSLLIPMINIISNIIIIVYGLMPSVTITENKNTEAELS